MPQNLFRNKFERRYVFTGRLVMVTALHIGGGRATLSPTDSQVLLGPDRKPFIPGSSFKGAFRSTVEKLGQAIALHCCGLTDDRKCPGAPGLTQKGFNEQKAKDEWDEQLMLEELDGKSLWKLCLTCRLFGAPFLASKVFIDDLQLHDWAGTTQIRDGVAIDRDSERAMEGLKYDFEVVPPGATFNLRIALEEPSETDLGLTCAGLNEFVSGLCGIGGKRSRGLGRCRLDDVRVYELDLRDPATRGERLKNYLLSQELDKKMLQVTDAAAFLQRAIANLLEASSHAEATSQ
jgi:CRISPR-associated RAMP protein (TIGR02581 family)